MSDYTPSTEEVTEHYREVVSVLATGLTSEVEKRRFDRWLTSVKAEAWDEGVEAASPDAWEWTSNPYREGVNSANL